MTNETEALLEEIKYYEDDENKNCFDCGSRPTSWVSVYFGIYLCLKCAGLHRSLGVHLSTVRSLTLDNWKEKHIHFMKFGGNRRAKQEMQGEYKTLEEKYSSNESIIYKQKLKKEVEAVVGESVVANVEPFPINSKYKNATSISSDEYFSETQKTKQESWCFGYCMIL